MQRDECVLSILLSGPARASSRSQAEPLCVRGERASPGPLLVKWTIWGGSGELFPRQMGPRRATNVRETFYLHRGVGLFRPEPFLRRGRLVNYGQHPGGPSLNPGLQPGGSWPELLNLGES